MNRYKLYNRYGQVLADNIEANYYESIHTKKSSNWHIIENTMEKEKQLKYLKNLVHLIETGQVEIYQVKVVRRPKAKIGYLEFDKDNIAYQETIPFEMVSDIQIVVSEVA